jgi:F-box domain
MEPEPKKLKAVNLQKSKITKGKKSLDPLSSRLTKKIYSLILQHLSGSDLLNLSEVSREFYQLVAESERAMDKIQLVINEGSDRVFKWTDLENSKRCYKTLKVKNLLTGRSEVTRIIFEFSDSLISIETNYDFKLPMGLMLQELETLKMSIHSRSTIFNEGLLCHCSNLTKLHFSGIIYNYHLLIECLESNADLEELVLEKDAPSILFRFMNDPPIMELTTLKCDNVDFSSERQIFHFLNFLESQADSLVELKVLRCEMERLSEILDLLPNLTKLTYSPAPYDFDQKNSIKFNAHHRLRELNLITMSTKNIKQLTLMAPRVQKLYIADVTQEIFIFAIKCLPSLREFRYAYFKDFGGKLEIVRASYTRLIAQNPMWNKRITIHQI